MPVDQRMPHGYSASCHLAKGRHQPQCHRNRLERIDNRLPLVVAFATTDILPQETAEWS
jgi:hypothetical protein